MIRQRRIAIILTLLTLSLVLVSCANPPESRAYENSALSPAEAPESEDSGDVAAAVPVDLSVLSDEELSKMSGSPELLERLENADGNDVITVEIFVTDPLPGVQMDLAINERTREAETRIPAIKSELQAAEAQKEALDARLGELVAQAGPITAGGASEVNAEIALVETEIEAIKADIADLHVELDGISQNYDDAVEWIKQNTLEPVLDAFAQKYPKLTNADRDVWMVCFCNVAAKASEIVEYIRDTDVEQVYLTPTSTPENMSAGEVENASSDPAVDLTKLNEAYQILGGNVAVSAGKKGYGVKIGQVELGVPDSTQVSNVNYIKGTDANYVDYHATNVATIINKLVPQCTIYATSLNNYGNIRTAMVALMEAQPGIRVINLSVGTSSAASSGYYNLITKNVDEFIDEYKIAVVLSSGNEGEGSGYVTYEGIAPKAITVGSSRYSGTVPSLNNAFTRETKSSYKEERGDLSTGVRSMINKPDF